MQNIIEGTISRFGGPGDRGMSVREGVALYEPGDEDVFGIFLRGQVGRGRGLNPAAYYCAMRWDYELCPKLTLRQGLVGLRSQWHPAWLWVHPADWGPNEHTGRLIDASPRVLAALGVFTDEHVEVCWHVDGVMLPLRR